ncbi:MAG: GNAT family N-acetyltransferase [Halieaceae bacterium]
MSVIEIRPVMASDEHEWRRLWRLYLEFYESTLPKEVFTSTFSRLLSDADREYNGLIALVDGKPVGLTHYLFHRSCWSIEDVCYLQDLYVDKTVRGTGAGRALIEAVYMAGDAAGAPSVYWHTQHFNYSGRRLYDRVAHLTPFLRYDRNKD